MTEIVPQYYSFKIKLVVSDSIYYMFLYLYYKQVSWFSSLVRCILSYFEFFYDYFHIPFWNQTQFPDAIQSGDHDSNNFSFERKSKSRDQL